MTCPGDARGLRIELCEVCRPRRHCPTRPHSRSSAQPHRPAFGSDIFSWRSRCYRRRRDLEAAREDVERALELAESLNDKRAAADVYFQASIIADREGHWVLARSYAERAKALYEAEQEFRLGERAYDQLPSASHRASAWVAQGDLAARRGDDRAAARLYRQAADALQDVRF